MSTQLDDSNSTWSIFVGPVFTCFKKGETNNGSHKNRPSRSRFSSPQGQIHPLGQVCLQVHIFFYFSSKIGHCLAREGAFRMWVMMSSCRRHFDGQRPPETSNRDDIRRNVALGATVTNDALTPPCRKCSLFARVLHCSCRSI